MAVAGVLVACALFSGSAGASTGGGRTSVIGGEPASIAEFPFMARITARDGDIEYLCSGTVVAPNLVLTAAHCLLNESKTALLAPSDFEVSTGTGSMAVPGTASRAERLAVDPDYQSSGVFAGWHDAGLIQLVEPVTAPAVRLATSQIWQAGTLGYAVGWGLIEGGELPSEMQVGETVVQSPAYCEEAVGPGFNPLAELCSIDYPSYQSATCNGDSGGPMLMAGDHELIEIGITSFAIEEGCPTDSPRVDTRADAEAAWVAREIAAHPPKPGTPPPAPAPPTAAPTPAHPATAPRLPRLTNAVARRDVFDALRTDRLLRTHFRGHTLYHASCRSTGATSSQCDVRWHVGALRYRGIVTISEEWEGSDPVWSYHYWIHRADQFCLEHSRHPGRCPHPLYHS